MFRMRTSEFQKNIRDKKQMLAVQLFGISQLSSILPSIE